MYDFVNVSKEASEAANMQEARQHYGDQLRLLLFHELVAALEPFSRIDLNTASDLWAIRPELCEAARALLARCRDV